MRKMWALAVVPVTLLVGCGASTGPNSKHQFDRVSVAADAIRPLMPGCGPSDPTSDICFTTARKDAVILLGQCDQGSEQLQIFVATDAQQDGAGVPLLRRELAAACPTAYAKAGFP